jgi:hypothetical protein
MDFDSLPKIRSLPQSTTTRPHSLPRKLFFPPEQVGRLVGIFHYLYRPGKLSADRLRRIGHEQQQNRFAARGRPGSREHRTIVCRQPAKV